jgi:hypothetical protein
LDYARHARYRETTVSGRGLPEALSAHCAKLTAVVTIFAVPKPFAGHVGLIQENALGSWVALGPEVEVLLCGDESGVAEAAARAGVRHLPDVELSELGAPLLDSVFRAVQAAATHPRVAYANADIILLPDFLEALRRVRFRHFLLVGRRWNTSLSEPIDFGRDDWEHNLRELVATEGRLKLPDAIDYFAFDRDGPLAELPPFVVGRPSWDNWMIYRARHLGIPVVDATGAVTAVHQDHDYSHVPEGGGGRLAWLGPEAEINKSMVPPEQLFQTRHATHVATRVGVLPALGPRRIVSRVRSRHVVDGRVERMARLAERLRLPLP